MILVFSTSDGSRYEIRHARDGRVIRRLQELSHDTRPDDGLWVPLLAMFPKRPRVGFRVSLVLGTDDGDETTRLTQPVHNTWEEA